MNIHEYQAKEVLRGFAVPVPRGKAAFTVEEAVAAAKELGGPVWVVKARTSFSLVRHGAVSLPLASTVAVAADSKRP